MFCTKCGKDNSANAVFCVACGKPMKPSSPMDENIVPSPPYQPPVPPKKSMAGLFVVLGIVVVMIVVGLILGVSLLFSKGVFSNMFAKKSTASPNATTTTTTQASITTPPKQEATENTPPSNQGANNVEDYTIANQIFGLFFDRDQNNNRIINDFNRAYLFDEEQNTVTTLLDSKVYGIHTLDGDMYYMQEDLFMRMDLETKATEQILSTPVQRVVYDGDMLYAYSDPSGDGDGYLYYAQADTLQWEKVYIGSEWPRWIAKDKVVYICDNFYREEAKFALWSIDLQTAKETKYATGVISMQGIDDGFLYYYKYGDGINEFYRIALGEMQSERIFMNDPILEEGTPMLFFAKDHMYVFNDGYGLYRMSDDGATQQLLISDHYIAQYNIVRPDLYGDDLYILLRNTDILEAISIIKIDQTDATMQLLNTADLRWDPLHSFDDLPSYATEQTPALPSQPTSTSRTPPTPASTTRASVTSTPRATPSPTPSPKATASPSPTPNKSGLPVDQTQFKKPSWFDWVIYDEGDASGNYEDPYFTNGRYVREDGFAVLYLDHYDSPDVFIAGLGVQDDAASNLEIDRLSFSQDDTGYAELYDDNESLSGSLVAKVVRKNVIQITSNAKWRSNHKGKALPDGLYYLVRQKK